MKKEAGEKLGVFRAIFESLWDRDISFFPRVKEHDGNLVALDTDTVIAKIAKELGGIVPSQQADDLEELLKLARQSLDEVTSQTEYQDGKATRLLTILTFMSAFSGLLFNRLADSYPVSSLGWTDPGAIFRSAGIVICYALFCVFALSAVAGALVTFHAIRARFRYSKEPAEDKGPKSLVFYMPMSRTQPDRWGKAFINKSDPDKFDGDLKVEYLKNYIIESYLVAVKVADKMRFLEPAQRLQSWAIKALLAWLIFFVLVFAFATPAKKESNPVIRAVVSPNSSSCIIGESDASADQFAKDYRVSR